MHIHLRRVVAIAVLVAVVTGAGAAFAAGRGSSRPAPRKTVIAAITSYLGLTRVQLRADLMSGQTPAQIAVAQGKTVAGLEQAIESAFQAQLDRAVAAGKITSAQESAFLSALPAKLDKLVNGKATSLVKRGLVRRDVVKAAAAYVGLTAKQLRTDLKAGQSLAQIATTHNKTVGGLEQAITAAVKARLDKRVAAGKLTAAREQAILAKLAGRLGTLVQKTR